MGVPLPPPARAVDFENGPGEISGCTPNSKYDAFRAHQERQIWKVRVRVHGDGAGETFIAMRPTSDQFRPVRQVLLYLRNDQSVWQKPLPRGWRDLDLRVGFSEAFRDEQGISNPLVELHDTLSHDELEAATERVRDSTSLDIVHTSLTHDGLSVSFEYKVRSDAAGSRDDPGEWELRDVVVAVTPGAGPPDCAQGTFK